MLAIVLASCAAPETPLLIPLETTRAVAAVGSSHPPPRRVSSAPRARMRVIDLMPGECSDYRLYADVERLTADGLSSSLEALQSTFVGGLSEEDHHKYLGAMIVLDAGGLSLTSVLQLAVCADPSGPLVALTVDPSRDQDSLVAAIAMGLQRAGGGDPIREDENDVVYLAPADHAFQLAVIGSTVLAGARVKVREATGRTTGIPGDFEAMSNQLLAIRMGSHRAFIRELVVRSIGAEYDVRLEMPLPSKLGTDPAAAAQSVSGKLAAAPAQMRGRGYEEAIPAVQATRITAVGGDWVVTTHADPKAFTDPKWGQALGIDLADLLR